MPPYNLLSDCIGWGSLSYGLPPGLTECSPFLCPAKLFIQLSLSLHLWPKPNKYQVCFSETYIAHASQTNGSSVTGRQHFLSSFGGSLLVFSRLLKHNLHCCLAFPCQFSLCRFHFPEVPWAMAKRLNISLETMFELSSLVWIFPFSFGFSLVKIIPESLF